MSKGVPVNFKVRNAVKYILIFLVLSANMFCFQDVLTANGVIEKELKDFKVVAQNPYLKLYLNEKTAEIGIFDIASNKTWFSNPQDGNIDTNIGETQQQLLASQVKVNYYLGQTLKSMNSCSNSVKYNCFDIEPVKDGLKIIYRMTLSKPNQFSDLPVCIKEDRFKKLLDNIKSDEDKIELENWYRLKRYEDLRDSEKTKLPELYPFIKDIDIYLINDKLPDFVKQDLIEIMDKAGYDKSERLKDIDLLAKIGGEDTIIDKEYFDIPVYYYLEDRNFLAKINMQEVLHDESCKIKSIELLQYFGATSESSRGYIFIPDGSGSIINFNNGKVNYSPVRLRVYGIDKAINSLVKTTELQPVCIPVFGIKDGESGFISIMEEGGENSYINADIAGRYNSYNYVWGEYIITDFDVLLGENNLLFGAKKAYEGAITQRYCFLESEDASYSDMAVTLREYLLERNMLPQKISKQESKIPFYLELLGSIKKNETFMGIPYKTTVPLTTFDQAQVIIEDLEKEGINGIKVILKGWFNGGISHSTPNKIKIERVLGGEKSFKKLATFLNKRGYSLYTDAIFTELPGKTSLLAPRGNFAKYTYGEIVLLYPFMISSNTPDYRRDFVYILKPGYTENLLNKFLKSLNRFSDVAGISLRGFEELNSDFDVKNPVLRHDTGLGRTKSMSLIQEKGYKTMINSGSYPMFRYTNDIVNLPLQDSGYSLTDYTVPFYQMIVHGYIPYSGSPANINQNYINLLLKSLETGSYPYFIMAFSQDEVLADTNNTDYYSINYKKWIDRAADFYEKANKVLFSVQDKAIIRHQKVGKDVFITTYENNYSVIVNYGDKPAYILGREIPSKGYITMH